MSGPPPGVVGEAGASVRAELPAKATTSRSRHFARLMRGRAAGYGTGLGVIGAAALAILARSPLVFALAAPAVVIAVVAIAYVRACRMAAEDFFTAFAAAHGFVYYPHFEPESITPLLSAGQKRWCEHYMRGPLYRDRPEPDCLLAHYTYEVQSEKQGYGSLIGLGEEAGSYDRSYDDHNFTICVVDIEAGIRKFPGIYCLRSQAKWLRGHDLRRVELESSDFCERYKLMIEAEQDELLLRQLFSPSFIGWLAAHPLSPCFEYRAGMLVVFVERKLSDGGSLQWLLESTRAITTRFAGEIGDAGATSTAA